MRLDVPMDIAAPREVVWDVLVRWEDQSDWMKDAKSVEVVSDHREGEGVTIHVPTNLMGFTTLDVMEVTEWVEHERLAVEHLGRIITGTGVFELDDHPDEPGLMRLHWREHVDPPLGALGEWGANTFVKPFTRWLFRRSLRNLAMACEREAAQRRHGADLTG